ncbi:hypothetical protein ScPMuIL_004224 [Solemya velum]
MLRYVILAVLAVYVFAQNKHCCFPRKWEARGVVNQALVKNGTPAMVHADVFISYDASRKMVALNQTVKVANRTIVIRTIEDFDKNIAYVISSPEVCNKTNISSKFADGCVPDSAKALGHVMLGYGADKANVKSFALNASGFDVILTVTSESCAPISETITGFDNKTKLHIYQTFGLYNMTPGVRNESVFHIPDACHKKNATGAWHQHGSVIGKRSYELL